MQKLLLDNLKGLSKISSDIRPHLTVLMNFVIYLNAKTVVELGVRGGVSTQALLAGIVTVGGHLYSYDIIPLQKRVGPPNTTFIERLGDSNKFNDFWTFNTESSLEAHKSWEKRTIDLLFIDTEHTEGHIYKELTLWYKKIKDDGYILLHDIATPGIDLMRGVKKFLNAHKDFVYNEERSGCGLGCIGRKI